MSTGRVAVVLPFGQSGVGRAADRAPVPGCGTSKIERTDAMITPAWQTATTVLPTCSAARRRSRALDTFVEAVPAVAARSEDAIGLGDHVERAVLRGVVGPVEPIGLTGVHLAQVAILRERLEAETLGR